MAACTFFGPADCPDPIRDQLKALIEDLILNHDVDTFYVGNEGLFDAMVRCVLWDLRKVYPHIQYHVVLAHGPSEASNPADLSEAIIPDGIDKVPFAQAVEWRNLWMLRHSDWTIQKTSGKPPQLISL